MTCKQATLLMSSGAVDTAPFGVRLALRVHLLMCKYCRAFQEQLAALTAAARDAAAATADEPRADLVDRIVHNLGPKNIDKTPL